MNNPAIPTDAALDGADTAADEFFRRISTDASEPSEDDDEDKETTNEEPEAAEDDDSDDSPESDAEGDEGDDDSESSTEEGEGDSDDDETEEGSKTVIDSEDAVVKIKVDGEEIEASIKDLKRLYGQEAALTRKSQEVAEIRKRAEEAGAYHVAGLEKLLERAKANYEPYSKLNFLALAKDPSVTSEELQALHSAALSAYENVQFLESEMDSTIKATQAQRHQAMMTQARETHKVLSDPATGIEGWGEPLYNEIRTFATSQGIPQEVVDGIVDPAGIKILHMAMKYAKGQKAITTPKTAPKKVDKTPKRLVKGEASETSKSAKTITKDAAFKKLMKTGDVDDAAEAFLSRFGDN